MFQAKSLYPILNSIYVKHKLPLKLKIILHETIGRFGGSNIGFTLGNFMELTSLTVFKVKIKVKYLILIIDNDFLA